LASRDQLDNSAARRVLIRLAQALADFPEAVPMSAVRPFGAFLAPTPAAEGF